MSTNTIKMDFCMSARYHAGDENGKSNAKFARFELPDKALKAGFIGVWLEPLQTPVVCKESDSILSCKAEPAEVIVRRSHDGDENGKTTYCLARVYVSRKMKDNTIKQYSCIAKNDEMLKIKESQKGAKENERIWAEKSGKVITKRVHKGDENEPTETTFSDIYINTGSGDEYKLKLTDVMELGEQTESDSDFYAQSFDKGTIFTTYYIPTQKLPIVDHTWVTSEKPEDDFTCGGGYSPRDNMLDQYPVDDKAHIIADYCRGKDDMNHISPYGIDGVCHQAANRFLYYTSNVMRKTEPLGRPRGYTASCIVYGPWGISFRTWYEGIYAKAKEHAKAVGISGLGTMKPGTLEYEQEQVYLRSASNVDDTSLMIEASELIFTFIGIHSNSHANRLLSLINEREKIAGTVGIIKNPVTVPKLSPATVREIFGKINDITKEFQADLLHDIGKDAYTSIFGDSIEPSDVIEMDLAVKFYS